MRRIPVVPPGRENSYICLLWARRTVSASFVIALAYLISIAFLCLMERTIEYADASVGLAALIVSAWKPLSNWMNSKLRAIQIGEYYDQ